MITVSKNGLKYIQFYNLTSAGIDHAIFTRLGGVSQAPYASLNLGGTVGDEQINVLENHQRVFSTFERPFNQRFDVWQVHGTKIKRAIQPRPQSQPHEKADGILTNKTGLTLLMRFADCVPVLLADPILKVIGVVHAGWKGTLDRICLKTIAAMQDWYGCDPQNVLAGIGPAICQECFEVGEDVYKKFQEKSDLPNDLFLKRQDEKNYIDLVKANKLTLEKAGLRNIESSDLCTAHNLDDWYSHRAENGRTGRFGVVISL